MIIYIRQSELFTKDPDERFARLYQVPQGLWKEMWKRYKLQEYTVTDIRDYFEVKTKKQLGRMSANRWILRTEIYSKVQPLMTTGVSAVMSDYFGKLEYEVIKELTKNIQSSVHQNPKVLV